MTLTDQQKEELKDYAGRLLPKSDICIIMQLNHDQFIQALHNPKSDVYLAYMAGYLATKAKVRKSVVDLAASGSSPAQSMAEGYIKKIELENFEINGKQ